MTRIAEKGLITYYSISHIGLNRPISGRTAAYGHFGPTPDEDGGFSWERTVLIEAIKAELS